MTRTQMAAGKGGHAPDTSQLGTRVRGRASTRSARRSCYLAAALALASAACHGGEEPPAATQGADGFSTIWTRPADKDLRQGHGREQLLIQRVAVSDKELALDVQLEADTAGDARKGKSEALKITTRVDGCPGPALRATGTLGFGEAPTRFAIARAAIPQGDLELNLDAFERGTSMLFRNDERGIRPITLQELKGYRRVPEDKQSGSPATAYVEQKECPQ
jgi:hypothetical protein